MKKVAGSAKREEAFCLLIFGGQSADIAHTLGVKEATAKRWQREFLNMTETEREEFLQQILQKESIFLEYILTKNLRMLLLNIHYRLCEDSDNAAMQKKLRAKLKRAKKKGKDSKHAEGEIKKEIEDMYRISDVALASFMRITSRMPESKGEIVKKVIVEIDEDLKELAQ